MGLIDQNTEKKLLRIQKILFYVLLGGIVFAAVIIGLAVLLDSTGIVGFGDDEGSGWLITLLALPAVPILIFCPLAGSIYSIVVLSLSSQARKRAFPLIATAIFIAITVVELYYEFSNLMR